jgi:hypothetical protein
MAPGILEALVVAWVSRSWNLGVRCRAKGTQPTTTRTARDRGHASNAAYRKESVVSTTDELIRNAPRYEAGFDKGDLPLPPARKIAIVACMDARLNVYGLLGLGEGDAHVIRNAGGVGTDDEIRSLAISQRLLSTEEIILIHHTTAAC